VLTKKEKMRSRVIREELPTALMMAASRHDQKPLGEEKKGGSKFKEKGGSYQATITTTDLRSTHKKNSTTTEGEKGKKML